MMVYDKQTYKLKQQALFGLGNATFPKVPVDLGPNKVNLPALLLESCARTQQPTGV